jgi:hypothetical protein
MFRPDAIRAAVERLLAEGEEQRRRHEGVEQGGGNQAGEDDDCHRVQDLGARRLGLEEQRRQREGGDQRRHQHRRQALQRAADDQLAAEGLAFEANQVGVVRELEDAVAGGDAGERDEADQRRDGQWLAREPQADDAADQCQRHVGDHQCGEDGRAVAAVEDDEDQAERDQRQHADDARRFLLRAELAIEWL